MCNWTEDEDGYWFSDCKHCFDFTLDGPIGNVFKFCPYCGEKLTEVKAPLEGEQDA